MDRRRYAIDAFVGELDRRPHEDADVGFLSGDQHAVRAHLRGWEACCGNPPGSLRPWPPGEMLVEPVVGSEVQLLLKAKAPRHQDERDFADAAPRLDRWQHDWLR